MSRTLPSSAFETDSNSSEFDLVALLLSEQQSLTAVERFDALHEVDEAVPAQANFYQALLPASQPSPGQQYRFQVDLDSCSGCKSCVVACHTMNGLEEEESWRKVGTVLIGEDATSRVQHVTTACHHCEEPGCLQGCPVKAYVKDPDTGIVRHLDDQCIGCKYCTMMCPYEVPQYSDRLGIVRKCDMCHQRLSVGEAPACVQSCPNEAISIGLVDVGDSTLDQPLAAGAPDSSITVPTTKYESSKATIAEGVPQDAGVDHVEENHWPLAVMLVATQVSVGMLLVERLAASVTLLAGSRMPVEATRINATLAFLIAAVGLQVASLHLGQPLRAWRVFLGLRTSWLSREAVVLGKYAGLLAAGVALFWLPSFSQYLPSWVQEWVPSWAAKAMLGMSVLVGMAGLFSSAMIYIATKRHVWRFSRTMTRFFGSAIVGGAAFSVLGLLWGQASIGIVLLTTFVAMACSLAKLNWEWTTQLGPGNPIDDNYDRRSRYLVDQHLSVLRQTRLVVGFAALALLALGTLTYLFALPVAAVTLVGLACSALLVAEVAERLIYFSAVVFDRMPGTLQ